MTTEKRVVVLDQPVKPVRRNRRRVAWLVPEENTPTPSPPIESVVLDEAHLRANGVFGFDPNDPRARPFLLLRSQLLARMARAEFQVIAVTSAHPQDGKSLVAANLAAALSQIHPVILLDLDLRGPAIAQRFGLPATGGVDQYLSGKRPLSECGCSVRGRDLALLPVHETIGNIAELLASDRTETLFAELRLHPSKPVILIDAPSVLVSDDLMILAPYIDAILLVVEEGRTRKKDVAESLRLMQGTPLLGTVLNKSIDIGAAVTGSTGQAPRIGRASGGPALPPPKD